MSGVSTAFLSFGTFIAITLFLHFTKNFHLYLNKMVSRLNGEENYFTRICVGGLLNTRKLELAHMLLQDINLFHMHPSRMPDPSSVDSARFMAAAIANLTAGDRRQRAHIRLVEATAALSRTPSTTAAPLVISSHVSPSTTVQKSS